MTEVRSARNGGDTLLQQVRLPVLGLVLAKHGALAGLLFGPPLVWALAEGAAALSVSLAVPIAVGGLATVIVWRRALPEDLRGIEAMASLAILFLLAALLAVPAFMALGLPPAAALFEGMSAITTTGLSMARDPDAWPFAAHVLRSWMQWCGGLAMATAVLALLLGPGPAAQTMGKAGLDDRNRIQSAREQARTLLGAYALLTALAACAIALALGSIGEGLVLALSAISTGGFAPRSSSLADYDLTVQTLVILTCLAGTISLLAFAQMMRRRGTPIWASPSVWRVGVMVLACAAALGAVHVVTGGQDPYVQTLLNLLSAFTTAGFATGPIPLTPLVLLLFCAAMIVGGDRGSTAGGIKLWRMSILARAARHALTLPRLPERAVAPLRHNGAPVADTFMAALLGLLLLYALTAAAVWAMLLGLGHSAMPALFDTLSALSTVGLSTGVIGPDLPPAAQLVLTAAMWLGRLEFIAVLVLILPRTWVRPRYSKG